MLYDSCFQNCTFLSRYWKVVLCLGNIIPTWRFLPQVLQPSVEPLWCFHILFYCFYFLSEPLYSFNFSYSFLLILLSLGITACFSTAIFPSLSITTLTSSAATAHLSFWIWKSHRIWTMLFSTLCVVSCVDIAGSSPLLTFRDAATRARHTVLGWLHCTMCQS